MRRGLIWGLSGTVVLSVAALWGSEVPRVVSAIEPRMRDAGAALEVASVAVASNAVRPLTPLPAELPQLEPEPAKRDVFVPYVPPTPPEPPLPKPMKAVAPPLPQPAPPPQAPALNLRFLGSMVTPSGQRLVYLARGDTAVPVAVGDRLDEGYVVNAIAVDGVTLVYPSLGVRAVVPISMAAGQSL